MEYNLPENLACDNWKCVATGRAAKEDPMSLFDDVKKNLVEWYAVTSEKTSEVARVTTRRYDKFGISRDIERQFSELGSLVYNGLKAEQADILAGEGVQALVERIASLETELQAKDKEIENIRHQYADRKAEAAAAGGATATVITDPVLPEGADQSAILVEPVPADPENAPDGEKVDPDAPEKEG
jgi:hypothetical protein